MHKVVFLTLFFLGFGSSGLLAQESDQGGYDSLKRAMIQMDQELYQVQLNLHQAQNKQG